MIESGKYYFASFPDGQDQLHHCLVCLSNQGDVTVYSIPNLKLQIKSNVMKKEDIR